MAEKVQLRVLGISHSESSKAFYCLLLEEVNGERKLPIVVGHHEAQTIAVAFDKMQVARPFMPDVFVETTQRFDLRLKEIFIYKKLRGVYFTKVVWLRGEQMEEIEARPSDAVALALRTSAPIYIDKEIIDEAGISPANQHQPQVIEIPLSEMNKKQLTVLLDDAVKEENYERAALIRDLLKTKI